MNAEQSIKDYVQACRDFERVRDKFRAAKAQAKEAKHAAEEMGRSYETACKRIDDTLGVMMTAIREGAGLAPKFDVETLADL